MQRQQSFLNNNPTLYLVATPIGNLEDITYRAVRILKEVDVIFAEDTRVSRVLLNYYNITTHLKNYHEYVKEAKGKEILNYLEQNQNVALVSDAGMPIISDPGYDISKKCMEKGYNVVIIPGPSALLSGLVTSGLNPHPFLFYGFISNKQSQRIKQLEGIKDYSSTLIFYESPHRIKDFLNDALAVLGDRKMALAREITKKFEEIIHGTISEVLEICDDLKGEFVLVIDGNYDVKTYDSLSIIEHVNLYIKEGLSNMDAIKKTAKDRGLKKQDVYNAYHNE